MDSCFTTSIIYYYSNQVVMVTYCSNLISTKNVAELKTVNVYECKIGRDLVLQETQDMLVH